MSPCHRCSSMPWGSPLVTTNYCGNCGRQLRLLRGPRPPAAARHQHRRHGPVPGFSLRTASLLAAAAALVGLVGLVRAAVPDLKPDAINDAFFWRKLDELYEAQQTVEESIDTAIVEDNGPKEISLFCPAEMQVHVADLTTEDRDANVCLVLNVGGPSLTSRLVLNCDGQLDKTDAGGWL
mmetsp:Transcript_5561/g.15550  ORF Transcript_5561/g.15550 Transcript_5561/m.15550 type:complete len:180 (-) Transcript_5561:238-777(-)